VSGGPAAERPGKIAHRIRAGRLVQLALTILACGAIVYIVDWEKFVGSLSRAHFGMLALAYALFVADRVLMGYKWGLLLRVQGIRVPLWERWGIYSLATLASSFLPATVGPDALRIAWLWRRGAPGWPVTASVVVERLLGFAVSLGIAATALLYLSQVSLETSVDFGAAIPVVLLVLLAVVGLMTLSLSRRITRFVEGRLGGLFGQRIKGLLGQAHAAYAAYRSAGGVLAATTVLTIAEQLLTLAMTYVLAPALGIEVPFLHFCAAVAVAMLVSRLPIAIDGIGVYEGVLILLLELTGVDPAETVALAIVGRALNIVAFLPGAILLIALTDLRLADLLRRTRRSG
jgi:uncharacterized protein (TIRG00374 family)